jgi:hypothetical protein
MGALHSPAPILHTLPIDLALYQLARFQSSRRVEAVPERWLAPSCLSSLSWLHIDAID